MRIVSLLPSATEILCLLGLEDSIVGITHECDFPKSIRHLPIVTKSKISHSLSSLEIDQKVRSALIDNNALYSINLPLLDDLKPDLLVTQSLCNVCAVDKNEVISAAEKIISKPKVINLEPTSLSDVFKTIELIAEETSTQNIAKDKISDMKSRIQLVHNARINQKPPIRVVYLEWIDPLFSSGHWICEIIQLAGGIDCLGDKDQPAKTIHWDTVLKIDPDVLIVGCCGYNLNKTMHDIPKLKSLPGWKYLQSVNSNRVFAVDGNSYFSRPSPRLIDSLELLDHMLHSNTINHSDPRFKVID